MVNSDINCPSLQIVMANIILTSRLPPETDQSVKATGSLTLIARLSNPSMMPTVSYRVADDNRTPF